MAKRDQGIVNRATGRRIAARIVLLVIILGTAIVLSSWMGASASAPVATQATTLETECSNGITVPNPQDNPGLVADCVTLLRSRDTLLGTSTALLNWDASTPIEQWWHVTVVDSRVTRLIFHARRLSGNIPPELGNLSHLQHLDLSGNRLTGSIPQKLGNLNNLQYLDLSDNPLSGSIPQKLGNLNNLRYLDLSGNRLTGSIPPELGNLNNLQNLILRNNRLTGSIPPELGNLNNLQDLILDYNRLTGNIPPELGNLNNLQNLILSSNQLTGSIPPELGNLNNLQYLNLSSNHLTGNIPPELGNLNNLQYLNLSSNHLTGNIPPELGNLNNLQYLYLNLSNNRLTGNIPPELGNLDLSDLYLSNNQLNGCIPNAVTRVLRDRLGLPVCSQATPTATPSILPTSTPTAPAAPSSGYLFNQAILRRCAPGAVTYVHGTVRQNGQPVNGYWVVFSWQPDGEVVAGITSGPHAGYPDKAQGYYSHILQVDGPREGDWWFWIQDEAGNRISEMAHVHTDGEAGEDKCQQAIIDFDSQVTRPPDTATPTSTPVVLTPSATSTPPISPIATPSSREYQISLPLVRQ